MCDLLKSSYLGFVSQSTRCSANEGFMEQVLISIPSGDGQDIASQVSWRRQESNYRQIPVLWQIETLIGQWLRSRLR